MSFKLEREMQDRLMQYHAEAAVGRALPKGRLQRRVARTLRSLADRLEQRSGGGFVGEVSSVVLQGRNQS